MKGLLKKYYYIVILLYSILLGYMFWLIIYGVQPVYLDTIIANYVIRTNQTSSNDWKIIYLLQYAEQYMVYCNLTEDDKAVVRDLMKQIDYKNLINDHTTLVDIKTYLHKFIDDYIQRNDTNQWFGLLKNVIGIAAISKVGVWFIQCCSVIYQLHDPYKLYLIGTGIINKIPHGSDFIYNAFYYFYQSVHTLPFQMLSSAESVVVGLIILIILTPIFHILDNKEPPKQMYGPKIDAQDNAFIPDTTHTFIGPYILCYFIVVFASFILYFMHEIRNKINQKID